MVGSSSGDVWATLRQPELLQGAVARVQLEACILGGWSASSEMGRIDFGTTTLDVARLGPSLLFQGETPKDHYTLAYVHECPSPGHSFNFSMDHGAGYLGFFPPGSVLDARTPEGFRSAILTIESGEFQDLVGALYPGMPGCVLEGGGGFLVGERESVALDSLLSDVWAVGRGDPDGGNFDGEGRRQLLKKQLCEAFLDALCARQDWVERGGVAGLKGRERRFLQIREYVEERRDGISTMAEVCGEFGVSTRTLENLFGDYLGIAPGRYLRNLRLQAARHDLLAAAGSAAGAGTVKRVAFDHGFWHLGRFSAVYREVFGELPNETLRLCRHLRVES